MERMGLQVEGMQEVAVAAVAVAAGAATVAVAAAAAIVTDLADPPDFSPKPASR